MGARRPWVIDLDGVIWTGSEAVPGSADAVRRLIESEHGVWFCTNNSSQTTADYETALAHHGIDGRGRVVSAAHAAASVIAPGDRVLCCSGPGVIEAVERAGAVVVDPRDAPGGICVDVVMVGFHRDVTYDILRLATRAVLGGARFVATNDDPIYPDADGPAPGCGAILAAIERASGRRAEVAGKPNGAMVALIRDLTGAERGVVVGDSPGTDGGLAAGLGWDFGLVLTGNTTPDRIPDATDRAWVAADLAELVERYA